MTTEKRKFVSLKKIARSTIGRVFDPRFRRIKQYMFYLNVAAVIADMRERRKYEKAEDVRIPSEPYRRRIGAARDVKGFLTQGQQCFSDLENGMRIGNRKLTEMKRVLDFGCGCGRTLRWLMEGNPEVAFHGVDIDKDLIEWCQKNIPALDAQVSKPFPPLPFESQTFDLIYSISVFSHLDEPSHLKWLEELSRVMKPAGIALISIHGFYCYKPYFEGVHMANLPDSLPLPEIDPENELEERRFVFDPIDPSIGYGNTFIANNYVREKWEVHFEVLKILPLGMGRLQDLVVLQKR